MKKIKLSAVLLVVLLVASLSAEEVRNSKYMNYYILRSYSVQTKDPSSGVVKTHQAPLVIYELQIDGTWEKFFIELDGSPFCDYVHSQMIKYFDSGQTTRMGLEELDGNKTVTYNSTTYNGLNNISFKDNQ